MLAAVGRLQKCKEWCTVCRCTGNSAATTKDQSMETIEQLAKTVRETRDAMENEASLPNSLYNLQRHYKAVQARTNAINAYINHPDYDIDAHDALSAYL